MNGTYIFVLSIIALSFGYGLLKAWINNRPKLEGDNGEDGESMLAKIDALEERIRVLERIVTDGQHDLKREIDQL